MNGPPKVTQLEPSLEPQQKVLRLQVPVYDVLGVKVLQRPRELQDVTAQQDKVTEGQGSNGR